MKMGVMTAAVVLSVLVMSSVAAADEPTTRSWNAGATVGLGVPDSGIRSSRVQVEESRWCQSRTWYVAYHLCPRCQRSYGKH